MNGDAGGNGVAGHAPGGGVSENTSAVETPKTPLEQCNLGVFFDRYRDGKGMFETAEEMRSSLNLWVTDQGGEAVGYDRFIDLRKMHLGEAAGSGQGVAEGGTPSAAAVNCAGCRNAQERSDEFGSPRVCIDCSKVWRGTERVDIDAELGKRAEAIAAGRACAGDQNCAKRLAESCVKMAGEQLVRFRAAEAERADARGMLIEALLVLARVRGQNLANACDGAGVPHELGLKLLREHVAQMESR